MCEHMFDRDDGPGAIGDHAATTRAAELIEAVLDELIRPDHNWSRILALSQKLTELARRAGGV